MLIARIAGLAIGHLAFDGLKKLWRKVHGRNKFYKKSKRNKYWK